MNADVLLKYFDRISEAPDAIPRLRRFILDLAVRGKLVEQDPQDEPASELLKRIQAEKGKTGVTPRRQGAKEGEKLGDLAAWREGDFEVPPSWEKVRIRQITSDRGQTVPKTNFTYIDVTAINKEHGCLGETNILSASEAPSRARKIVQQGDVIYSCVRPYLLNIAIIESEISPQPIASTAFAVLNGFGLTLPRYIWIVLRSPFIVEAVESLMRGQAYPAINDSDFAQLPFPLPPLAEQHRIVAKVDELMALCDQLEAARNEREARRQRLTAASLQRLNQPVDAASLRADARFHLDNLTRLTTRPEQIKQLRQTILNLAVRGCLVPQDPQDEPVNLPIPLNDELSEMLPARWRKVRLADLLAEDTRNGFSRRPDDAPDGIPILRISAGTIRRDGVVAEEEHKLIGGIDLKTRAQFGLKPGDLLACRFNGNKASVGRLTIFNDYLGIQPIYPDKLIRIRVASQLSVSAFLRLAGDTDIVRNDVEAACATTVGNWGISASNLKEIRFPLPPLAEQHRIVARVDELMALCDQLETQLTTTATDSRRLLEAVLRDAIRPQALPNAFKVEALGCQ
jgi:type I restriction enzyme S subunit